MSRRKTKKRHNRDKVEFYKYETFYEECMKSKRCRGLISKRHQSHPIEMYDHQFGPECDQRPDIDSDTMSSFATERHWYSFNRPYYLMYPAAIECLKKVNLNVPLSQIRLPERLGIVAVHFPKDYSFGIQANIEGEDTDVTLEHFFLTIGYISKSNSVLMHTRAIFRVNSGPRANDTFFIVLTLQQDADDQDVTVESFWDDTVSSTTTVGGMLPFLEEHKDKILRLAVGVCLLGADKDSDLLRADVLPEDRDSYRRFGHEKYIRKAKKQGRFGWTIGEDLEKEVKRGKSIPHYRRRHYSIRWMGTKPNLKPVLRQVRATIVNKKKMTEVPTGYLDK